MIRKTFSVPPLGCNCSIIGDPVTKQAIVVDPGGASERILREVQQLGLTVTHIFHTHAHFDHFLASGSMKDATGAILCLHQDDRKLWENLEMQCQMFGVAYVPVPMPDYWLRDEEKLLVGQVSAVALHTPGHTPGSMSFHFPGDNLVLAGDTLFRGSIGRTDLWGGDFECDRTIHSRAVVHFGGCHDRGDGAWTGDRNRAGKKDESVCPCLARCRRCGHDDA